MNLNKLNYHLSYYIVYFQTSYEFFVRILDIHFNIWQRIFREKRNPDFSSIATNYES